MNNLFAHPLIRLVIAITAILLGTARADTAAVSFDTTQSWSMGTGTGVYGWQFTAESDILVSKLGIYDNPGIYDGGFHGDGLLEEHTIGIWDVSNPSTPLTSSLMPLGVGASLVDGFRYVAITPLALVAGHHYVIAATYQEQDWTTGVPNNQNFNLTVSPGIDLGGYRFSGSSVFQFPDGYDVGLQYGFGPNFTFTQVPEPSTFALCLLGAATLCGSIRLRRIRRAGIKHL